MYTERDAAGGVRNLAPSAPLDAGQLIVRGPGGSRFLTTTPPSGGYETLFSTPQGGYLEPGQYTVEGTGSAAVPAFEGHRPCRAVDWTLVGDGVTVNPQRGSERRMDAGRRAASTCASCRSARRAVGEQQRHHHGAVHGAAGAGRFSVAADYLANAPVSAGSGVSSTSALFVGLASLPERGLFSAQGLDVGFVTAFSLRGRPVTIR